MSTLVMSTLVMSTLVMSTLDGSKAVHDLYLHRLIVAFPSLSSSPSLTRDYGNIEGCLANAASVVGLTGEGTGRTYTGEGTGGTYTGEVTRGTRGVHGGAHGGGYGGYTVRCESIAMIQVGSVDMCTFGRKRMTCNRQQNVDGLTLEHAMLSSTGTTPHVERCERRGVRDEV
jgi:hypothetical protein